jgi:spore coat protein U-like protein
LIQNPNPERKKSMKHLKGIPWFVAALLVAASVSFAASTATSDLSVTASVADNCIISTSALAFGSYDPISANASSALNGTGSVSVTCTSGASANVTLGQGSNADTGSTDAAPLRRMADGSSHFLSYDLYSDSSRTAAWGNTSGTGVDHTGTGASASLTVYGSAAGGQNVPSGSYSDTVVATVTF